MNTQEYMKKYKKEHPEKFKYSRKNYPKHKESKLDYQRKLTKRYKQEFLDMYGGRCSCCGQTLPDFLTIEHKLGQEKSTRRTGLVAYRDSVKEYRPDLYEILCWNCNCAKGKLGYCPHNPPKETTPYRIHNITRLYNYTKAVDSLGRKYK
jgi:hypothetical protein